MSEVLVADMDVDIKDIKDMDGKDMDGKDRDMDNKNNDIDCISPVLLPGRLRCWWSSTPKITCKGQRHGHLNDNDNDHNGGHQQQ